MTMFQVLLGFVLAQRFVELIIARRNEQWLLKKGGVEYGQNHYPLFIILHVSFLLCLTIEVNLLEAVQPSWWFIPLLVYMVTIPLRVWIMVSLGKFWNTKILILPQEKRVNTGLYRWLPHPNYMIVSIELLCIPLIFGAYWTSAIFSILNAVLLRFVRIPMEERALEMMNES